MSISLQINTLQNPGASTTPNQRFAIGNPNMSLMLGKYADGSLGGAKTIDPQDPSTWYEGPVEQYNAFESFLDPYTKTYVGRPDDYRNNMVYKLNTYSSTDPNKTLEQAYSECQAAFSNYAKANGLNVASYNITDKGVQVNLKPPEVGGSYNMNDYFMFVTWDDIGFNSGIKSNDDGGALLSIDSPIFGKTEVQITNSASEQIDWDYVAELSKSIKSELAHKTADWYESNGLPPSTYDSAYKVSQYNSPDFSSFRSFLSPNGLTFQSSKDTGTVANAFIDEYADIEGQKNKLIEELQAYYSKDEIIKRIQNAGITNEENIAKILEAQLDFGRDAINAIKERGAANLTKGLEESLTNHLESQLKDIANIFGVSNQNEFAHSVAKGALGMDTEISLGKTGVSYDQFSEIENGMKSAHESLKNFLQHGNYYDRNEVNSILDSAMKLLGDLGDKYGSDIAESIAEWSEKLKSGFINAINDIVRRPLYNPDDFHSLLK